MENVITLDGSKFVWHNDRGGSQAIGWTGQFPEFPTLGRAPKTIAVRSPRTGWTVVFSFTEVAEDDDGTVTLNYTGVRPDGRRIDLGLGVG
jgi:hypothetical protein